MRNFQDFLNRAIRYIYRYIGCYYYKSFLGRFGGGVIRVIPYVWHKARFKEFHFSDRIINPILLTPKYIELEEHVHIRDNARIEGVSRYNDKLFRPNIRVCSGVSIEQNLHLTCANSVCIGKNTAIAANVTITDISHPYINIDIPIEHQDIEVDEVVIGEDCKIYNNVVILPGVHIGRHVTIGANSVVNCDISDYSIAVGSPARVVKCYDFNKKEWIKVK